MYKSVAISLWILFLRKDDTTFHFHLWHIVVSIFEHLMQHSLNSANYSSLPNRRDVTAINFLRIFHPKLCYFSHHVYWKWPKLRTTTLISGTTFSGKIKESSSSASPNSVIATTASLKIRARFWFSHKSVKINSWAFYFFSLEALADSRKSIRKRIANKQWTYCSSFMSKTRFYSLAHLFWFFCLLITNLIRFLFFFLLL